MPIHTASRVRYAGYAYTHNVLKSFSLVTEGKLSKGQRVDAALLRSFKVISDGDATPVIGVWRHLELIDHRDCVTDSFVELANATGKDYENKLWELLEKAYADIIPHIDVSNITRKQLAETFKKRGYKPQTYPKMASLFVGLADAAGQRSDDSKSFPVSDKETSDTSSSTSLNDVLQPVEGYTPMPEFVSLFQSNGTIRARVNDTLVLKVLANFEKLRQQRLSVDWTETSRAMWEDQLKLNETMLEQAWELMEGKKQ